MDQITSGTPSVIELLANKRFDIDYYQREYRWEQKQVNQIFDDLYGEFYKAWRPAHDRVEVAQYPHYFLGPVILVKREHATDIVDGQQRLTTLTLLLIALRHRLDDEDHRQTIGTLIVTTQLGRRSFTLAVKERERCMNALWLGDKPDFDLSEPSVRNLIDRFEDIEALLESVEPTALAHFADWVMHRVFMNTMVATNEVDAYTVFETMNDRGLRLTAPEMLRGYLLSRIESPTDRSEASDAWKDRVTELAEIGKGEDVDAIQAWLRGRRAESASRYVAETDPGDYERIGNEFHRWVRDVEATKLGLDAPSDFADFILKDFDFYVGWYARLRRAAAFRTESLETVQYIASQGFTLQYAILLAALHTSDNEHTALRKIRATAAYVDILIHRRLWNSMRIGQTYLRFPLFELAKRIRRAATVDDLVSILTAEIQSNDLDFSPDWQFRRNQRNWPTVRRLLARLTLFIEAGRVGVASYADLITTGRHGYDIEHVMADKPEHYAGGFADEHEFAEERNWIGGLLLIPSSVNRSYGALDYAAKREHYLKQNLLAASLHPLAYVNNPEFNRFIHESELPFTHHERFGKDELHRRQALYEQIAAQVWSPKRIRDEAGL